MKFLLITTIFVAVPFLLAHPAIPQPVLLIPGLGGSQMQARLNRQESCHWYCQQSTSGWYRIWMSVTSLLPYSVNCFIDNFRLVHDWKTGRTENVPGVETRVEDFGNVTTIEYFFDLNLDFAKFFQPIISRLEGRGYERTQSLRAAQYDFRKAPYESDFAPLTTLIEQMYTDNDSNKVVLVCHSYGCTYAYHFLVHVAPMTWKDRYIHSWVTLGAAFGGSTQSLQAILSGYNLNMQIGFLSPLLARSLARTFTSVYASLPVEEVFTDQAVVMLEGLKFTVKDMHLMFRLINDSMGESMWRRAVKEIDASFPHPRVEVHCLRATGTDTVETLVYNSMSTFPDQPIIVSGPGDGSVNKRSADLCLKWRHHPDFHTKEFDASVDHMSFVQGNQAADYILDKVLGLRA